MNNLTVFERDNQLLVESREVAAMVGKDHAHLMRDIDGYIAVLRESKFGFSDFFIPSTYKTKGNNKTYPCYLLTKKGCDMVSNKLTGNKGVIFTAKYVTAFEQMREHIQKGTPLPDKTRTYLAEAKLNYSRAKVSSMWLKIAEKVPIPEYQQICAHYASGVLAGKPVFPLPESGEQHLSAKEVGELLGVSAQKVGSIANANGLKTPEYGKWYHDKSPHSPKEVDTFKYNAQAVERFKDFLT